MKINRLITYYILYSWPLKASEKYKFSLHQSFVKCHSRRGWFETGQPLVQWQIEKGPMCQSASGASMRVSMMEIFMEDWLWLAHWPFFYFSMEGVAVKNHPVYDWFISWLKEWFMVCVVDDLWRCPGNIRGRCVSALSRCTVVRDTSGSGLSTCHQIYL